MTFTIPQEWMTYLEILHAILFIIAFIVLYRSRISAPKKVLSTIVALYLPIIGSIIVIAICLSGKRKSNNTSL